jgi:peroxiredoxin
MSVGVHDVAPALDLPDDEGRQWRLSDHRGRPAVLIFHRHLACLPCQEHAIAVSDRIVEFGDALVVLITFTRPRNLRGFRHRLGLAYPVLADENRSVYRAYGLGRGSWWRVWGLSTMRAYGRQIRAGHRPTRPEGDTLQLGGDFVIDRGGRITYAHRSTGPADRPSVDDLLAAVRDSR